MHLQLTDMSHNERPSMHVDCSYFVSDPSSRTLTISGVRLPDFRCRAADYAREASSIAELARIVDEQDSVTVHMYDWRVSS